jgi:hypothetical protein
MMSYSAKRSSFLNAHNPKDNNDDSKDNFYQDSEQVFCHFPLAPYAKSDRFQRCHIKRKKTHRVPYILESNPHLFTVSEG